MCVDLTARTETSTCVAYAVNWGNIGLQAFRVTIDH